MNRGVPPTARKARTGEFTPPGMTAWARASSTSEAGAGVRVVIDRAGREVVSIATFVGRKNTKGAAVAVGVSGQTSFARFIKLPPVEAKQIPQIVRFEAIQQIPFPLDDVEWALKDHPLLLLTPEQRAQLFSELKANGSASDATPLTAGEPVRR